MSAADLMGSKGRQTSTFWGSDKTESRSFSRRDSLDLVDEYSVSGSRIVDSEGSKRLMA